MYPLRDVTGGGIDAWEEDATTSDDLAETRVALKRLIQELTEELFSWGMDDGEPVTIEAAETAKRFLDAMPLDRELPKVASDGDGGLYMAWEMPGRPTVLVGVVDGLVYAVLAPGTPESRHIPEMQFDGVTIPAEILSLIPVRVSL